MVVVVSGSSRIGGIPERVNPPLKRHEAPTRGRCRGHDRGWDGPADASVCFSDRHGGPHPGSHYSPTLPQNGLGEGWARRRFQCRNQSPRTRRPAERLKSPQQLLKASRYCCEAAPARNWLWCRPPPSRLGLPFSRDSGGEGRGEGASPHAPAPSQSARGCRSPISAFPLRPGGSGDGPGEGPRAADAPRSVIPPHTAVAVCPLSHICSWERVASFS